MGRGTSSKTASSILYGPTPERSGSLVGDLDKLPLDKHCLQLDKITFVFEDLNGLCGSWGWACKAKKFPERLGEIDHESWQGMYRKIRDTQLHWTSYLRPCQIKLNWHDNNQAEITWHSKKMEPREYITERPVTQRIAAVQQLSEEPGEWMIMPPGTAKNGALYYVNAEEQIIGVAYIETDYSACE